MKGHTSDLYIWRDNRWNFLSNIKGNRGDPGVDDYYLNRLFYLVLIGFQPLIL